ncbi:MAG TPA: hypothetical protein VJH55_02825 [Candidatus Paceibacterota bacterium]
MATSKKRINISVSKDMEKALTILAERDDVPQATKASELLAQAIEIEEDAVWEMVVKERMRKPRFVSHEEAWNIKK